MNSTSGSWPLSRESRRFPSSTRTVGVEIARLVMLGVVATALHAATRGRFKLPPGHQGLAWIALVMIGRLTSGLRWAGVTTALGASGATLMPLWRLGDPFLSISYLAAGTTIDMFCRVRPAWQGHLWVLAILGGMAHATKPLVRFLITGFTGWRYESLMAGLPFPVASHFLFGAMGTLLGAGLIWARRSKRE